MVEAMNNELGGLKESSTPEQRRECMAFVNELMHLTSLLFAVMMKQLRKDYNLSDLYDHEKSHHAAYVDSKKVHKGPTRWWVSFVYAMSLADFVPPLYRPQQELAMPVLGGVRPSELKALEESTTSLDMQTKGGDLNGVRTVVVFGALNKLFLTRMVAGGQAASAGFQNRVMSIATESMAHFAQCAKIAATQFPFPWAQLLMVLLSILGICLPFVVTSFVDQVWVGIIASFMVMTAFWSINETAVELDEPFGTDPNDLPLARFVYELNQNILAAKRQLKAEYGDDGADTMWAPNSVYGLEDEPIEAEGAGAARTSAVRLEMTKQH
ncbi:hypothetical protein HXX76_000703 [Chlamydomonas incerta]|uniref:Uncharacterized protein n=1 Tax=Chlamydomonas incerta TaxID=51695 RepID=A0A835WEW9_CHLIN|nr:hypothetical protein HXX76_000703 [Chlamydomonas incerta]|eukprot:KAG2446103.1 hypothetical protein HXX76_000703 [Chlamydomonas incerta]